MANQKIPGLDHLRALAIILVFLFHYRLFPHPAWADSLGSFGWTGVDLFFVLSGYLIAGQIFKDIRQGNFSLKVFFLKRFFRILPAYWLVLSLYFMVPTFREWESLPPLWKFLSFTQNFGLDLRATRTFSHAWSLCIEEQFYFLLPLTVLILQHFKTRKHSSYIVLGLFLAGFAARHFSWQHFVVPAMDTDAFGATWYEYIYFPTYNRLDGLLAGISIAGIVNFYQSARSFIERYANMLLPVGLAVLTAAYFLCIDTFTYSASVFGYPLIALGYGLMVAASISPISILNRSGLFITKWIATLSYSIYLVHKAAIHFTQIQFGRLNIEIDSSLMFACSAGMSLLFALILHYCVERPFLRLKENILNREFKHVT